MKDNKYIGSNFDDFLKDEGILEECTNQAKENIKKIINDERLTLEDVLAINDE